MHLVGDLFEVHVGFVVDEMALRQVYLRIFRFPFSVSFHKYFKISGDIILATVSIVKQRLKNHAGNFAAHKYGGCCISKIP